MILSDFPFTFNLKSSGACTIQRLTITQYSSRVDVGMTQMMGGKPEVLEIVKPGKIRVLTEAGPLEGEELIRLRSPLERTM